MSCAAMMYDTNLRSQEMKGCKPHTRLQQRCLDLQQTLPPLTEAQYHWARSKMEPLGYFVERGRGGRDSVFWCQECGQMDKADISSLSVAVTDHKHTCSRCGRRLELTVWNGRDKHVEHNFHFVVVTTCDGMQVARVFNIHQYNSMGSDTVEHVREVFSVWIEPKTGKETIVSRPYTRSPYHFRWHTFNPMKIGRHNGGGTGYYYYNDTYDLSGMYVYPHMRVLPILRRNGFTPGMASRMKASIVELWKALLSDPAIEGLAKNLQYDIIDYWFQTGDYRRDKSQWLPLLKICNRRKYVIKDASLWFDLVESLRELGLDTRSPKYICPDDLKAAHDLMQRRVEKRHVREEIKRLNSKARDWEAFYAEKKGRYFGITFDNGDIFCHVISSVAEMVEEGETMHHCVYQRGYYKKPESLILSARDRGGNRLETVEVNLDTFSVVQSRGLQNHPTLAHNDIVKLVEANMKLIKKATSKNS